MRKLENFEFFEWGEGGREVGEIMVTNERVRVS